MNNTFCILSTVLLAAFIIPLNSSCAPGVQAQAERNQSEGETDRDDDAPLVQLGTVRDSRISESSGLARSSAAEGAYWTHNDSGNAPEIYLLAPDGRLLAEVAIEDVQNRDWEAMSSVSVNGANFIMIGEVGDNARRYRVYRLLLIPEPLLSDDVLRAVKEDVDGFESQKYTATALQFEFTYEDGRHNCEAIAYDSVGKKVWLVEKVYADDQREAAPGIYSIDFNLTDEMLQQARGDGVSLPQASRVADFPVRNVTGMSISAEGNRLLIRTYLAAFFYSRDEERSWAEVLAEDRPANIGLPLQRQGEAVCFSSDSDHFVVTSESTRQAIWQVNLRAQLDPPAETVPADEDEDAGGTSNEDGG